MHCWYHECMFRKMRRFKQELSKQECFEILQKEKRAVLAVYGEEGYPYALPINFYFDAESEKIYFHSAKEGHKADAIKANPKVCLTVYEQGTQKEDWSYYVRSVILFGKASLVEEEATRYVKAKAFGVKYYPSEEEVVEELSKDFARMALYEVSIDHISGKLVQEK